MTEEPWVVTRQHPRLADTVTDVSYTVSQSPQWIRASVVHRGRPLDDVRFPGRLPSRTSVSRGPLPISKYLASKFRLVVCGTGESALLCLLSVSTPTGFSNDTNLGDPASGDRELPKEKGEGLAMLVCSSDGWGCQACGEGTHRGRLGHGNELEAAQASSDERLRQGSDSGSAWGRGCQVGFDGKLSGNASVT